jgi:hypothetical protein
MLVPASPIEPGCDRPEPLPAFVPLLRVVLLLLPVPLLAGYPLGAAAVDEGSALTCDTVRCAMIGCLEAGVVGVESCDWATLDVALAVVVLLRVSVAWLSAVATGAALLDEPAVAPDESAVTPDEPAPALGDSAAVPDEAALPLDEPALPLCSLELPDVSESNTDRRKSDMRWCKGARLGDKDAVVLTSVSTAVSATGWRAGWGVPSSCREVAVDESLACSVGAFFWVARFADVRLPVPDMMLPARAVSIWVSEPSLGAVRGSAGCGDWFLRLFVPPGKIPPITESPKSPSRVRKGLSPPALSCAKTPHTGTDIPNANQTAKSFLTNMAVFRLIYQRQHPVSELCLPHIGWQTIPV